MHAVSVSFCLECLSMSGRFESQRLVDMLFSLILKVSAGPAQKSGLLGHNSGFKSKHAVAPPSSKFVRLYFLANSNTNKKKMN